MAKMVKNRIFKIYLILLVFLNRNKVKLVKNESVLALSKVKKRDKVLPTNGHINFKKLVKKLNPKKKKLCLNQKRQK